MDLHKESFSLISLPEEIILYIATYLTTSDLFQGLSCTCWYLNNLISRASSFGNVANFISLSSSIFINLNDEEQKYVATHILTSCTPIKGIEFHGFNSNPKLIDYIINIFCKQNSIKLLKFQRCDCTSIDLAGCKSSLETLWFDNETTINTKTWEVLASGFTNLKELLIPNIPSGFIPLILKDKNLIESLEVGEVSNKLIHIICNYCPNLRIFTLDGGQLTYSGIVSLFPCKSTLQELKIRNPKYLTKFTICMLSRNLTNLRTLHLFWLGKLLINNPWDFEFCLDREEQRVDLLFQSDCLKYLEDINLSAFYQTVDDKTIQQMCFEQLSSQSIAKNHLLKIDLSHCYRVTDAGVQWVVGSCHSPALLNLDLSNTSLTGNCFLRRLPHLHTLKLDCCSSLTGIGLSCVAASCTVLRVLSLAKNKQLQDSDFENAFKTGFKGLIDINCSYNNLTGQCFQYLHCELLANVNLNCCSKLKNEAVLLLLQKCTSNLRCLDISVTKINDKLFSSVPKYHLTGLKSLFIDFCSNVTMSSLVETIYDAFPYLRCLSIFGISDEEIDTKKQDLRINHPRLRNIFCHEGTETEEEVRIFAKKRGLYLTNWMVTKMHLIKNSSKLLHQIGPPTQHF